MARKGRFTSVSNSTKKTTLSGKRVSKKVVIKNNEIEETIQKNRFLDFNIQQKYKITPIHEEFLEACFKDECKMVLVDGPAGSAKTYLSVYIALQLLRTHKVSEIIYIRSIVESASKSMGSLPGEVDEKFLPWCFPLFEKLNEFLDKSMSSSLITEEYIKCVPVNYVRGLTFNNACVIVDEAQNLTQGELTTILTRFGEHTKYIVTGDTQQSDIGAKTGFKSIVSAFDSKESYEHGIYTFKFNELDIVRSEILKYIVKVLQKLKVKR
jgi:phosphate starvation-inducible PhoH-like protein